MIAQAVKSRIGRSTLTAMIGFALLSVLMTAVLAASARAAGAPPGLPGPPPGAGSGIPLPPAPGQPPPPEPSQSAITIPTSAGQPGLLNGFVGLSGKVLKVGIACQGAGSATLSAATVAPGTLAKARYRCSGGRSTIRLALTSTNAMKIARLADVLASLALKQGGATTHLSLALGARAPAPTYWTSFFGFGCTADGSYEGVLTAPNFTDTTPTTIDVRPWLAWYTAATGWQWEGTLGPNHSAWHQWTATPTGVAEWQPGGTINPWTWGPISVTPGHGTYVLAVFDAVYWYSNPVYVWSYAASQPGNLESYCAYP